MATLVFDTLRVGFPTANVTVTGNGLPDYARAELQDAAMKVGAQFFNELEVTHAAWIRKLIETQNEPFWILDTDIIFYEAVEHWKFETALAGYRVPDWMDEYTGCITRSRLHPSLMWIDPVKVRAALAGFQPDVPTPVFAATDLLSPIVIPFNGNKFFHDTTCLLYHAIGGTAFTNVQKNVYFHFHFGTVTDIVLPRIKEGVKYGECRDYILAHPESGRGKWRKMEECYADRQFVNRGVNAITPLVKKQLGLDAQCCHELCCGDQAAMEFIGLWYHYCHGVDDLIDTMQDGRPIMDREQMIHLFFLAAVLYNHKYFLAHRDILYPIALQTTNSYADSVAWENSSKAHLRTIGDVLRTCGNEMCIMVSLLCGGEAHMRKISQWMKERDWLEQHDEHGNPL